MNNKIILTIILSMFLLSTASAMTVYGDFLDGSNSAVINTGESIDFEADFFSMESAMTVKVGVYSGSALVKSFLNTQVNEKTYADVYTYTPSNEGTYTIKIIGTDKTNTDSEFLTLTVNSHPLPPVNHAPEITSVPIGSVDEGDYYSYDVNAHDDDGDSLTYSLVSSPYWLDINSATGLVSGTAPEVVSGSEDDYIVTVRVSDSHGGIDTQSYTLTVEDTNEEDDEPPIITVIVPVEGEEYHSTTLTVKVTTNEEADVTFSLDYGATVEMHESGNTFIYTLHDLYEGKHYITFFAEDEAGNEAAETVDFYISCDDNDDDDDCDNCNEEEECNSCSTSHIIPDPYSQYQYYNQHSTGNIIYKEPSAPKISSVPTTIFYVIFAIVLLGLILAMVFLIRFILRR